MNNKQNNTSTYIINLLSEILKTDISISFQDDIFDLVESSIYLLIFIERVSKHFQISLTLEDLFQSCTLDKIAKKINELILYEEMIKTQKSTTGDQEIII